MLTSNRTRSPLPDRPAPAPARVTPLTTPILASAGPQSAGAVSGALSTIQQMGNSIDVAVTRVIFFGAVGHGYAHAFGLSVAELGRLLVGVAALSRLLPGPPGGQQGYSQP